MPQITIGAKEKWQPYSWFIYNHLGQISHTHTHTPKHNTQTQNTHAPMRNQHQKKEKKES